MSFGGLASLRLSQELAVRADAVECNPPRVLDHTRSRDFFEHAVLQVNVCDWRLLESTKVQGVLALPHFQIANADGSSDRCEAALVALLVIEVDRNRRVGDLTDLHIPHVDLLDQTAAHGVVLKPEHTIQVWAVHVTVLGKHIPDTA